MSNEVITDAKLLRQQVVAIQAAIDTGAGTDAIRPSVINGKGDIVVGTAANTPAVIPVGSNGQVLSSDSATVTGLKWIAPPAGGGGGGVAGVSSVNNRTGDVSLTKTDVGLGSVDNTSDLSKPISTATQSALNAKISTASLTAHTSDTANPHAVTKAQVGLGNVDNTSDLSKPISTATQSALNAKASTASLTAHTSDTANPHATTKAQVGLGNVDNTSDLSKPISTAVQAALDAKATSLDVAASLSGKANTVDVNDALSTKESLANRGVAGGYAGLNSATRVAPSQLGQAPVVLTDATSIITDASLSNQFRVTLAGNRTLANPTNPFDGQLVMWSIKQDANGSRNLTLGSKFRFGTDITSVVLSTAGGKTDKLGAQYDAAVDKWDVVSFVRGF